MTTYYLDSTNGLDTNAGTSTDAAWKTISKLNTAMSGGTIIAGDTVLFCRGQTFAGSVTVGVSGTSGSVLTFGAWGTGARPIIDGGANLRTFVFSSRSYLEISSLNLTNGAYSGFYTNGGSSYVIIADCVVSNSGSSGAFALAGGSLLSITISNCSATGGAYGILCLNCTNISSLTVSGCTFSGHTTKGIRLDATGSAVTAFSNVSIFETTVENTTGIGVYLAGCTNIALTNCIVRDNTYDGLYILGSSATPSSAITVTGCTVTGNGTNSRQNGISLVGDTGTNQNCTFYQTTSSNNYGDGFNVHGTWANVICDSCVADENGVDGTINDGDGYTWHDTATGTIRYCLARNNKKTAIAHVASSNVDHHHNILVHNTNGTFPIVSLGYVGYSYAGTYTFNNNTIYSGGQTGIGLYTDTTGGTITAKNNIIYGCNYGFKHNSGTLTESNNCAYGAATSNFSGFAKSATDIEYNPRFTDPANGDFTISTRTSPVIGVGANLAFTRDYAGTPIPGPDIGACQFSHADAAAEQLAVDKMTVAAAAELIKSGSTILDQTGTLVSIDPGASNVRYGVEYTIEGAEHTGDLRMPNGGANDSTHWAIGDASLVAYGANYGAANASSGTAVLTEDEVASAVSSIGANVQSLIEAVGTPMQAGTAVVLAASQPNYAPALETTVQAIQAKTGNLPEDPASEATVEARLAASAYTEPPTVEAIQDALASELEGGVTVTANNDKTDYSLTASERTSIAGSVWNALASAISTTGSIGAWLLDNITGVKSKTDLIVAGSVTIQSSISTSGDLTLYQGDGGNQIIFTDTGSNWPTLTGLTPRLQIAANRDLSTLVFDLEGVVDDSGSGIQVIFTPTSEDTSAMVLLHPNAYVYKVVVELEGEQMRHLAGPDSCTVLW